MSGVVCVMMNESGCSVLILDSLARSFAVKKVHCLDLARFLNSALLSQSFPAIGRRVAMAPEL